MTDRELLELAAKALGLTYTGEAVPEPEIAAGLLKCGWNPLVNDGDALKLAVRLRISLAMTENIVDAQCKVAMCSEAWGEHPDPYAATRRAIVRAAAEIGRAMK